jgi:hypothetical protein
VFGLEVDILWARTVVVLLGWEPSPVDHEIEASISLKSGPCESGVSRVGEAPVNHIRQHIQSLASEMDMAYSLYHMGYGNTAWRSISSPAWWSAEFGSNRSSTPSH